MNHYKLSHFRSAFQRTDPDIAQAALSSLRRHPMVPRNRVAVVVANGHVTLKGVVDREYQKRVAINAVRDLSGIAALTCGISVKPGG